MNMVCQDNKLFHFTEQEPWSKVLISNEDAEVHMES